MMYRPLVLSLLAVATACSSRASNPTITRARAAAAPQAGRVAAATQSPAALKSRPAAPQSATMLKGRPAGPQSPAALKSLPAAQAPLEGPEQMGPRRMAGAVLAEVNAARRRSGSPTLRTDAGLARAARRYARELARRKEIEHTSTTRGRRTFRQRIAAEGARARVAGENLARLSGGAGTLPARTVRAWLRSPGHRYNMLDPGFARTGVGVWLGADGIWYIVQEFATAH